MKVTLVKYVLSLLQVGFVVVVDAAASFSHQQLRSSYSSRYLYNDDADDASNNEPSPVREYVTKSGVTDKPDFLTTTTEATTTKIRKHRVVQFYASHNSELCLLLRPAYVKLARRVRELLLRQQAAATTDDIEFHAVSCFVHKELCDRQNITRVPTIRLYTESGLSEGTELKLQHVHPLTVLERFGIIDGDKAETQFVEDEEEGPWNVVESLGLVVAQSSPAAAVAKRSRDELQNDAHLAFDASLRAIYQQSHQLSKDEQKKGALKKWFLLLQDTLPASWWLHELVKDLTLNFVYVARSKKYLTSLLDELAPVNRQWSPVCSQKQQQSHSVACGTWDLLFAATTGVVRHNQNALDRREILSTANAARTVRNYIDHFGLGDCDTCRTVFLELYGDSCADDGECTRFSSSRSTGGGGSSAAQQQQEWKELPLWLAEMRTNIQMRLFEEKAYRDSRTATLQEELAAEWPSRSDCPRCWKYNGQLDRDKLYEYLKEEYGVEGHRTPLVATEKPQGYAVQVSLFLVTVFGLMSQATRLKSDRRQKTD